MSCKRVGGAKLWTGGSGETIVLVHGAWGGAELHWARVWEILAERFFVVAPELPGIGDDGPGLASFDAYAGWLAGVLDALEVSSAWCVGNSLGAAVAWQLAARLGPRCRGVVLVNGVPPPRLPPIVRALLAIPPLRALLRGVYRRLNFAPSVLTRAFADPACAPSELVRVLAAPPQARLELLLDLVANGAPATAPPVAPRLVAWGAADRLAGTAGPAAARKLQRTLAGAALVLIPSAGHCPQLERPAAFVDAIAAFVSRPCGRSRAGR